MSSESPGAISAAPWRTPMTGRDPDERHRAATPLELLFDLCFVVAIAAAAAELHHAFSEGHFRHGLASYAMVFFAIWWAWMNFTWFASAYDTDDVLHRLLTLLQMGGALVLAAGVPAAFEHSDFTVMTMGYVVMRVPMVAHWLRAAHDHPACRDVARAYAAGIALVQVYWVVRLFLPTSTGVLTFLVGVALELLVPVVAERRGPTTPWHPGHIAERYGLFTIITLGEVILASTVSVREAFANVGLGVGLVLVAVGGLLILFAMWWMYFKSSAERHLRESGRPFVWGYGHLLVFASVPAVGAALAATADVVQHEAHISDRVAALTLAACLSTYVVSLAWLHGHQDGRPGVLRTGLLCAAVLLAIAAVGLPPGVSVLLQGLVMAAAVADHLVRQAAPGESVTG